jgi:serine/threonine-protein kinase
MEPTLPAAIPRDAPPGPTLEEGPVATSSGTPSVLAEAPVVAERCRVLHILGSGGMGVVYLAERVDDGTRVALKLLRSEYVASATLCARLRLEAQAVRRIAHPNVVALLDEGDAGEVGHYVAFEFLPGRSLSERLAEEKRLPVDVALDVIDDVLAALEAAHAAGIVHRDLKPANVHLGPSPETGPARVHAKVLDFGISRLVLDGTFALTNKLTQTGVVIGTPIYMAPEQALGIRTQDHRVDIYPRAWCCTKYDPALDPALAALVHRAIAREPEARFGTAAEFREALRAWRNAAAALAERTTEPASLVPPRAIAPPSRPAPPRRASTLARRTVVRPLSSCAPPPSSNGSTDSGACLELRTRVRRGPHDTTGRASRPTTVSTPCATSSSRDSAKGGPMSCSPTGSPCPSSPQGRLMAGTPARLAGSVHTSARYIASGSSTFAPSGQATTGEVGVASTSTFWNASAKSRRMRVRTFCALP